MMGEAVWKLLRRLKFYKLKKWLHHCDGICRLVHLTGSRNESADGA